MTEKMKENRTLKKIKGRKTWWFGEIVVTLHPLFVAPVPKGIETE
jgi:hypothetical protein